MTKKQAAIWPPTPINTQDWADWLELNALTADDGNASFTALRNQLRRTKALDSYEDEIIEQEIDAVFSVIVDRLKRSHDGYPFALSQNLLQLKSNLKFKNKAYIFCLILSSQDISAIDRDERISTKKDLSDKKMFPARLFEHIATCSAKAYISGEGLRFGWPRETPVPKTFAEAVNYLCEKLGEGESFKANYLLPPDYVTDSKDRAVDIVVWRSFPDNYPGKLVLFGQCAAGHGWKSKIKELDPTAFEARWLSSVLTVKPVKALFIPYCLSRSDLHLAFDAGILFDRCRIAATTDVLPPDNIETLITNWCDKQIQSFRNQVTAIL